ncbi:uncharacterized protein [Spinacia oleracea]|uniref:Reverse transcriptase domain-containing protein n=1 Tax=Spinacia oleracea TaxID=3562 RepID=A0ABM3QQU9_SPIOL|nr:uncharacterized protein LOC130461608 [Spinacia oleracea]
MWISSSDFLPLVTRQWQKYVYGCHMFRVTQKLKWIKSELKILNHQGYSDVETVKITKQKKLAEIQDKLHQDPYNATLAAEEKAIAEAYREAKDNLNSFLYQTAKMKWLEKGDENSKLFFQSIKQRRKHNAIYSIQNLNGEWLTSPDQIQDAFLEFYGNLFCSHTENRTSVGPVLMDHGPRLTDDHRSKLACDFSLADLKRVLDDIPSNKAPGLDGFNSHFFKTTWEIVKGDMFAVVSEFFRTGKMLKEINVTSITLVPKITCVLPDIISQNQGLLLQGGPFSIMFLSVKTLSKCIEKKAYDTVEWEFIKELMEDLGFPTFFIELIMTCLSTTQYSVMINGVPSRLIHPRMGLRQGDPLSPLLFTLCMEYFSRTMKAVGEQRVISMMMEGFKVFSNTTGLKVNASKSSLYCCGMNVQEMFLLPKNVLKKINSICRDFLWYGTYDDARPGPVAWDHLCLPKPHGGLGFRNLLLWNQAAVGKQVWAIAQKQDNLWVKWIHVVYIKEKNWESFATPAAASWVVKFVCKVKICVTHQLQSPQWYSTSRYSIKDTYSQIATAGDRVTWQKYVWNRLTIPKHRFILWLTMLDTLKTTERLHKVGIVYDDLCPICFTHTEKIDHRFYTCEFSKQCKHLVLDWLGINLNRFSVTSLLKGVQRYNRGKCKKAILFTAIASLVYNVRKARNAAVWAAKVPTIHSTVANIKAEVKGRVYNLLSKKSRPSDLNWFNSL